MHDGPRFVVALLWRVCLALLPLFGPTAFALNPHRSILDLHHRAWTVEDGAPTNIQALAQTTDGYLWIGTVTGLFRFDGARFQRFEEAFGTQLPSNDVYSLWAPPSGGLWIGFRFGGATFLKNGRIVNYSDSAGLATGTGGGTHGFAQDQDGTLWAATSAGLMRLDGQRWHAVGAERHFYKASAWRVFVDREGTLWVTSDRTIAYLRRGAQFFEESDVRGYYPTIAQSPDGNLWFADTNMGVRRLDRQPAKGRSDPWVIHARATAVLVDRGGAVWSATFKGVSRVADPLTTAATSTEQPALAQNFAADRGLSSDRVLSALEDRQGNLVRHLQRSRPLPGGAVCPD